jgi:hypothetical protein
VLDSSKMHSHFLRAWDNSREPIQCPGGLAGQVRPRRSVDEEAHRLPPGKQAPGAEINLISMENII